MNRATWAVSAYAAAVLLASASVFGAAGDDRRTAAFVLAGQSNMVGAGRLKDIGPSLWPLPANVKLHDFSLTARLKPVVGRFGPEAGFSEILVQEYPDRQFVLFKSAVGGTGQSDWAPGYDVEKAGRTGHKSSGPLYERALNAIRENASEMDVQFNALLWMQGERDARFAESAAEYASSMQKLIHAFRSDLQAPELCVLIGQINPVAEHYTHVAEVRAAQAQVAAQDPRVFLVSTEGLSKLRDQVHYDSEGQTELGRRFGVAWLEHCQKMKSG